MKKISIDYKPDAKAQRKRLIEWLRKKPCTTIEARHELDIISPAPRIYELRHNDGYNIKTIWTMAINPGGRVHRVAQAHSRF